MATLREFVKNMSSLPGGSSIRDHIENPQAGSGSGQIIENIDGTIIEDNNLDGEIIDNNLSGAIEDDILAGIIREDVIIGEFKNEDMEGMLQ